MSGIAIMLGLLLIALIIIFIYDNDNTKMS